MGAAEGAVEVGQTVEPTRESRLADAYARSHKLAASMVQAHLIDKCREGTARVPPKLAGESLDAYHVFVGGGFGKHQEVGRQIFNGVIASELPRTLERILKVYLEKREGSESFQQFTRRHDVRQLQELFTLP